jgi:hypothetical protein
MSLGRGFRVLDTWIWLECAVPEKREVEWLAVEQIREVRESALVERGFEVRENAESLGTLRQYWIGMSKFLCGERGGWDWRICLLVLIVDA